MRPDILNTLFTKVNFLKGVGPKLYIYYKQLLSPRKEDTYLKDLLFHLPYNILRRAVDPENLELNLGKEVLLKVKIVSLSKTSFGRRRGATAKALCGNAQINLVFYNANEQYLNSILEKGSERIVCGKVESYKNKLQIIHPHISKNPSDIKFLQSEPVYPLTAGITNKQILKLIRENISKVSDLPEWLDKNYISGNNLPSFNEALKAIHSPKSHEDLMLDCPARKRLAFDELLASQLAIGVTREKTVKIAGKEISSGMEFAKRLISATGFSLTQDQRNSLKDITKDLNSNNRMFRLIQGDVGSGKTIIGAVALLNSIEAGFQGCFMAPTEILAKQHFAWLSEMLETAGLASEIKIALLVGSLKKQEKELVQRKCIEGEIDILIGTHALFQEKVSYKNLGLIVIDEQHKFGVKQRFELANKGDGVNVLFMTATPIPRTLSMTLYGDMDISIIQEKPAGRKPIKTSSITSGRISELVSGLDKEINLGQRVYWVCPFVEPSEDMPFQSDDDKIISVTERYEYLKNKFGNRVGMVHGQMPADKKDQEIEKFRTGALDILVATTVIEVGVNVPEATIMVIENSERFGLSQLHQLRGRVGRGEKGSSCVLVYSNKISNDGRKRIKIMKQTNDGFVIAEEDMILRGSGELLGTKQSGLPEYKIAVLPEHKELLFAARDDVKIILEKDPKLTSERGRNLKNLLYLFDYDSQIQNLNA